MYHPPAKTAETESRRVLGEFPNGGEAYNQADKSG